MLLRRMLFLAALLLLTGVVANAFVQRERDSQQATAPEGLASTPGSGAPRHVDAKLPARRLVRASAGDLVTLTVTTEQPATLAMDALGIYAETSAQVPGTFEFVAPAAGRYPVVDDQTGATVGVVVVSPRAGS
jgi:hypothetical protein